jgi:Zn-dependent peptidase ImmA (M78 family)/transcriptional regulator with XRE-family HTH domain
MSTRVEVNPELLAWARQRSGLAFDDIAHRFPMLAAWERGEQQPTLKQLESFAQATHTSVGFLFLPEPPVEKVPIPDYRTIGDTGVQQSSANLLDTIYQCQQRQDWYRDFAILNHERSVEYVGSLSAAAPVATAAHSVRTALGFDVDNRGSSRTDALRMLIERAEALGFLVMVNGVVGSNTHRKLDPREFRGFALADPMAPLVFVNGADTKAAQIFTLLHELAHLWLGGTALDDVDLAVRGWQDTERWCNQVAAEVLMPLAAIPGALIPGETLADMTERLSRRFKVSTLVVLRRLYDAGTLSWDEYRSAYDAEFRRLTGLLGERASGGGNFYNTQPTRFGRRFTRAVITSTLEGHTLYRDALQLLSFKKVSTLNELASRLGIG